MSLIIKTNLRTGGLRVINLLHVSTFDWKDNNIHLKMAHNKQTIFGNFLYFYGGNNEEIILNYQNKEDAKKEFNSFISALDNYYKTKI